jgi:hypothetical protein
MRQQKRSEDSRKKAHQDYPCPLGIWFFQKAS